MIEDIELGASDEVPALKTRLYDVFRQVYRVIGSTRNHGMIVSKQPLIQSTATAGVLSWRNPENRPIIVLRLALYLSSYSGSGVLNFGVSGATPASSKNLIDQLDPVTIAPGVADNLQEAGPVGESRQYMEKLDYLTGTFAVSGGLTTLEGDAYICYIIA